MVYDRWLGEAVPDSWAHLGKLTLDIPYAFIGGLEVSFYATDPTDAERLRSLSKAKVAPEVVEPVLWSYSEAAMREHYPELFCEPDAAVQRVDWARARSGLWTRSRTASMARTRRP